MRPVDNLSSRMKIAKILGEYTRKYPRVSSAMAFGAVTLVVQHIVWVPRARLIGIAPALTVTVGVCHAFAGAITGPRIIHRARTSSRAALLGVATSLMALVFFTILFTLYLLATGVHAVGLYSKILLPALIALFAFVGDAWVLMLVSIGAGWALYRIAASDGSAAGQGRNSPANPAGP